MVDVTKAYEVLKANKTQYKAPHAFYKTADQLGMTASELGKLFAKSRRSQSNRAAVNQMVFAFEKDPVVRDFIETGESHD